MWAGSLLLLALLLVGPRADRRGRASGRPAADPGRGFGAPPHDPGVRELAAGPTHPSSSYRRHRPGDPTGSDAAETPTTPRIGPRDGGAAALAASAPTARDRRRPAATARRIAGAIARRLAPEMSGLGVLGPDLLVALLRRLRPRRRMAVPARRRGASRRKVLDASEATVGERVRKAGLRLCWPCSRS